ncbi:MAG: YfcE family phosphodiesterase [Thermoguttaceae bacterium]
MKIGVISDTHGEIDSTQRALELLDGQKTDLMIHCGDIGLEVIPLFRGRRVHFVNGNVDDPGRLREAISRSEHAFHLNLGSLEVEGRRVAFLHGDDIQLLHQTIHSGQWDLVCHGHTHAFSSTRHHETLVLNPGALSRTDEPSVGVVEMPSMAVTKIGVDQR